MKEELEKPMAVRIVGWRLAPLRDALLVGAYAFEVVAVANGLRASSLERERRKPAATSAKTTGADA